MGYTISLVNNYTGLLAPKTSANDVVYVTIRLHLDADQHGSDDVAN